MPGISYAAAEGGTQANQVFYLRGFPAGGDIFIDGVRDLGEYNRDLFATEIGRGAEGAVGADVRPRLAPAASSTRPPRSPASLAAQGSRRRRSARSTRSASPATSTCSIGDDNARCASWRSPRTRAPTAIRRTSKRVGIAPSVRFGIGHPHGGHALVLLPQDRGRDRLRPADAARPRATGTGQFGCRRSRRAKYYGFANHDFADHETQHRARRRIDHRFSDDATLRNVTRIAKLQAPDGGDHRDAAPRPT